MAQQQMPDEMSRLIHDFVRPNPYKKKWDAVVEKIQFYGDGSRYGSQDSMAHGRWVKLLNEWEWDVMMVNCIAPPHLLEAVAEDDADYIQNDFLSGTFSELMLIEIENESSSKLGYFRL